MANMWKDHYDFIVIGGGTAGNVIAGRLAENPNVKILIIEAGAGNPRELPEITTPAHTFQAHGDKHDWCYRTTFVDTQSYRRIETPNTRGKILGGSSSLNCFAWVPGSKKTFDSWADYGGDDWTWENCKEYFTKKNEPEFSRLGRDGPLNISHANLLPETAAFREALIKAWESKGLQLTRDVYSGKMEGLTHCVATTHNGVRSESSVFITNKPNVDVMASTIAKKINFEGNSAVSVTVMNEDGSESAFKAKKEIILSGGVFETPKLLLLSGIGPRTELAHHAIDPVVISEHVGENLMDHPILPHVFRLKDGMGLDNILHQDGPLQDDAKRQYDESKTGPLASGILELIAFCRIDDRLEGYKEYRDAKGMNGGTDPYGPEGQPHFEIDFMPIFAPPFQRDFSVPEEEDWMTVIVNLVRPQSRNGFVRLTSLDPHEQPEINLNYFSNKLDILVLREGVRFIDDVLMTGDGMKDIIHEDYPWPIQRASDKEMDSMILDRAQTGFNPCGTARMSRNVEQGVVDPELRVHGVRNLRVVDASIIPVIPDCRIQNAVYMIGEKGADFIKSSYPSLFGQYKDISHPFPADTM
ncbi:Glucose-methanol-choline oxidoreductase [Penicillium malachiteum]|uniref:Glucose-methanol-choline oxidoreductase n=1 Tax=Penicillium malachiteum TaxID=1324776 RepID=A0AAD6HC83_9EURO|nr:Glucose-methanol-choline oxidoreductase [Penicillium malachiteum]